MVKGITCEGCIAGVHISLVERPQGSGQLCVEIDGSPLLPSYPGIRFILALAISFKGVGRYKTAEESTWVENIKIKSIKEGQAVEGVGS